MPLQLGIVGTYWALYRRNDIVYSHESALSTSGKIVDLC